jgi:hypothetical protein
LRVVANSNDGSAVAVCRSDVYVATGDAVGPAFATYTSLLQKAD